MPAPAPGPLAERVAATRPELRHLLKAGLLVAALKSGPEQYGGIVLLAPPKVNKQGLLELLLHKPGRELNNPFLFGNPPLLVPDGGTWTTDEGDVLPTYMESPFDAAWEIISQAVG